MSRSWRSIDQLNSSSKAYSRIRSILSDGNFDYLASRVLQARNNAVDAELTVTFDRTRYAAGTNNLVLELTFSDDVIWILRVPLRVEEDTSIDMLSEIATMRYISERTTIPVAKIFAWETTPGDFGFPYIVMERLMGDTMPRGLARAIPDAFRSKVARLLANVLFELSQLTFDKIGRLVASEVDDSITIIGNNWHAIRSPMTSSLDYFYGQRYEENMEVCLQHVDDGQWNTACWILTSGLGHVTIPDRINGPFSLCHLDLYYGNLLFDDDYNLTGVIDWSNAQTAPLEQLAVLPDLMSFISPSNTEAIGKFKSLLIEALTDLERNQPPATKLSAFLTSVGAEIYSVQYMNTASQALTSAQTTATLIYQGKIPWGQLVLTYGKSPPPQCSPPADTDTA